MAEFIDTYIKPPLERMASYDDSCLVDISLSWSDEVITIAESDSDYVIQRNRQQS
jgi:hypothetical protein